MRLVDEERSIEGAAALLKGAGRLVAFTGAGMSEESGIPTFRDPGGLWDRYDPDELGGGDIFSGLLSGSAVPGATFQFISEFLACYETAEPNPGHSALVELQKMGLLRSVITQNIDNLHSEAGNTDVIEVHGNICRLACMSCGGKVRLERGELISMGHELLDLLGAGDLAGLMTLISRCPCGGACMLDVVNFGQPVQQMPQAAHEGENCDVMLILGTSGVVWPAASLPIKAKRSGARLIEVNASECCFADIIDVGIVGKTGEVLPRLVELVRAAG